LLRSEDIVPFSLGNDILATTAESLASYLEKIAEKLDASDLANFHKPKRSTLLSQKWYFLLGVSAGWQRMEVPIIL
jgi:hypothetical protein